MKEKNIVGISNQRNLSETKISSYKLLYIYAVYTGVVTNLKEAWKG